MKAEMLWKPNGPFLLFYRPQTKFAKVMLLHLSVSLSVWGCVHGGHVWQGVCAWGCAWWGACVVGGMHGRGCVWWGHMWQGGMHGGGHVHGRACMGVCGGGHVLQGGHVWQVGGMHGRGAHMAGHTWEVCVAGGHARWGCVCGMGACMPHMPPPQH